MGWGVEGGGVAGSSKEHRQRQRRVLLQAGWGRRTASPQTSPSPPPAGSIEVQHEQGLLRVDGWAKFKAPARIAGAQEMGGGGASGL